MGRDRRGSGTPGWLTMIKDAYRFLLPLLALAALALYAGWTMAGVLLLSLSAFVAYFFRNPARTIPPGEHRIVSPADGKVVCVTPIPEGAEEMPGGQRVSIFLNIFNVHVTRSPIRGELEHFEYKRGKFKVAYDEDASRVNEQNVLTIRGRTTRVVVKQIAGLIARRVVCWKRPGDVIERGELFGLIRFGSRVDLLVARDITVLVKVGDHVQGGSSVIGEAEQ
jgi:phosphatidylserine decarboxylase